MKKSIRILPVLFIALAVLTFSGCGAVSHLLQTAFTDMPTADNTYTSVTTLNLEMIQAMQKGETRMTFNIADADEAELTHLADDMPTFWGKPSTFTINNEFKNMDKIEPGKQVTVRNVTAKFDLSNNYYVYQSIKNSVAIPDGHAHAAEIAKALPDIAKAIFTDPAADDYTKALAVHDWLVANITYDDNVSNLDDSNGSYGGLITKKTMCRGYAESFCLLLYCYTNVETYMMVGDARQDNSSSWIGHAWNIAKLDGKWMQIDATFDDPLGNPDGVVLHTYFGQSDALMKSNHRWADGYYPATTTEDFYYFKKAGLYAADYARFQDIARAQFKDAEPARLQIAGVGAPLTEDNIQFLFKANKKISELYWSEQVFGDVHVSTIEPKYADETQKAA
ncbi:MAG: hypothetical protein FWF33_04265 [Clostridiales bacterium]|nr:hypothetical protein [Clostridiales bacterium]